MSPETRLETGPKPDPGRGRLAAIASRYPHAVSEGPRSLRLVLVTGGADPARIGVRLRSNRLLAYGALAVEDGVLVLRAVVFVAATNAAALDRRLCQVASEAAELNPNSTNYGSTHHRGRENIACARAKRSRLGENAEQRNGGST